MVSTFRADMGYPVSRSRPCPPPCGRQLPGPCSLALSPQGRSLDRLRHQHLLREDQVLAVVVRDLVLVAHGDRVERARDLAVAAEDAAGQVDLVHLGVALAGRLSVVGVVLGGDHPDAVGWAGRGAQRAADALLEPGVLEAVQLVAAPETRVDGRLLLRVLDRHGSLDDPGEGRLQAAKRLAEGAVGALGTAWLGPPLHRDHPVVGEIRKLAGVAVAAHVTVTSTAVTSTLSVASGKSTFQPRDISWS